MVSEAPRGAMTFDKTENVTDRYRQSNRTTWKNSVIRITWKPLEPGLKHQIQLLAKFCHPLCDMKFADPREKSVLQTNDTNELKTQGAECQGPGTTKIITGQVKKGANFPMDKEEAIGLMHKLLFSRKGANHMNLIFSIDFNTSQSLLMMTKIMVLQCL